MTDYLEYAKRKIEEIESTNEPKTSDLSERRYAKRKYAKRKIEEIESTNEPKTSDLSERKLDLFKVNKILQDDLDRQIILPDSDLKEYYDFYKKLDEDKASYQQQYFGANKAAEQDELRVKTHEFFEQIREKHPRNKVAINLLQEDLTKKIYTDVNTEFAMFFPYLMLQTITYFDQIDKIQDNEAKSHYLSQFPMNDKTDYKCIGGFSARLNPILMTLNSKNLHLTSAHQSAVSSSILNKGTNVHQQAMINALFGINLKDEHYLLSAGTFNAEKLWQAYLDYPVKLQEQFLLQQEEVKKNVIDLANLFTDLKNGILNKTITKGNITKLKEEFRLNDADFYKYDKFYMVEGVDDKKVEDELEKRANNYYPMGIDLPDILKKGAATIKDFNAFNTSKIIRDILHDSDSSPSEKNVAFNYLWIRAVKEINGLNTTFALYEFREENLLQILNENKTDEQIKSLFEQKKQQSLDILRKIASSDDSTLTQDKLALIEDKLALNKISGKQDLLLFAVKSGYLKAVQTLLEATGIEVNKANEDGSTALMIAAKNGHAGVVQTLLEARGIDVNKASNRGFTALMIAAQNAHNGHVGAVQTLLEARGIEVNKASNRGFTALMIAAHNGHVEVVQTLLEATGIEVNKASDRGYTALMIAAHNGHVGVVKELLTAPGIEANKVGKNEFETLMIAAEKMIAAENTSVAEEIFKKLCKNGLNPIGIGLTSCKKGQLKIYDTKIFTDACKISHFADEICDFISYKPNSNKFDQQRLDLLVRKSLFKEIFTNDNEGNVDSIIDCFKQNKFRERVYESIVGRLQSPDVLDKDNTQNIEYNVIEDLFLNLIKESIKALEPDSDFVGSPLFAAALKTTEINVFRS